MAVNVGMSIGWGYPNETSSVYGDYVLFSTFYVLVGASFIGVALGFFADQISEDHDNWFTNMIQQRELDDAFSHPETPLLRKVHVLWVQYRPTIRAVSVWFIWIFIMAVYSARSIAEWSWLDAQYFAISSCSTGGHWALPQDATQWQYGLTAFFAMVGVCLHAVAMASIADLFVDSGDVDDTKRQIHEEVTREELLMLQKFGLEDNDGVIDKAEFIILSMVRMGMDINLIEYMSQRFSEIDSDGNGTLSIREITGGQYFFRDGKMYRYDQMQQFEQALPVKPTETFVDDNDGNL